MYADPSSDNPIASAVIWLQGTLLGSLAVTIAIIAVASVGFLMLTGRIDFQRATRVLIGCFIIFGASTIATGIEAALGATNDGSSQTEEAAPRLISAPATAPDYPQAKPAVSDPYAGAAVPTRQ